MKFTGAKRVNFQFTLCEKVNKVLTLAMFGTIILAAAAASIGPMDQPRSAPRPAVARATASVTIVAAARIDFAKAPAARVSFSTGETRRLVEFE